MKEYGKRGLRVFDAKILMVVGAILAGIPIFSLFVEVTATGHQVTESDAWFFYLTRFGLLTGCATLPIGVLLFVVGLVKRITAGKS